MTDPITPEEQAVIEAAEALVARWAGALNHPSIQEAKDICSAVKALRASRKSNGVDPRTLEAGTRFRYPGKQEVYRLIEGPVGCFSALDEGVSWLHGPFTQRGLEEGIIPIEEEAGECEHKRAISFIGGRYLHCPDCDRLIK